MVERYNCRSIVPRGKKVSSGSVAARGAGTVYERVSSHRRTILERKRNVTFSLGVEVGTKPNRSHVSFANTCTCPSQHRACANIAEFDCLYVQLALPNLIGRQGWRLLGKSKSLDGTFWSPWRLGDRQFLTLDTHLNATDRFTVIKRFQTFVV